MQDKYIMKAIEYARNGMFVKPELTLEIISNIDVSKASSVLVMFSYEMLPVLHELGYSNVTLVFDKPRTSIYNIAKSYGYQVKTFEELSDMKFDVVIGNPPYQPPIGIKKGGGFYEKFINKALDDANSSVTLIVPFTWQIKKRSKRLRMKMVEWGLNTIKHLPPETFSANVLTSIIHLKKGYNGPIVQSVYDVLDKNVYHNVELDRNEYYDGNVIPIVRNEKELNLHNKILRNYDKELILHNNTELNGWAVEYSYLIGLQKEKLNIEKPMRCIKVIGPGIEKTDTTHNYCHVPVGNKKEAVALAKYLDTTGQTFFRTIPRGSSMEKWMVSPVVSSFRKTYVD